MSTTDDDRYPRAFGHLEAAVLHVIKTSSDPRVVESLNEALVEVYARYDVPPLD